MPTYQYRCNSCGYEFEEFQNITDSPVDVCPRCNNKPERVISGGMGFLFRGSGFYTTDYRSESYKQAEKREKETVSSATKDPEKKPSSSAAKKDD